MDSILNSILYKKLLAVSILSSIKTHTVKDLCTNYHQTSAFNTLPFCLTVMSGHDILNDHQYTMGLLISDGANTKFSLSDACSLIGKSDPRASGGCGEKRRSETKSKTADTPYIQL